MKSRWLMRFPPRPQARARLLCLPGAGAAPAMFRSWSERLPQEVEVCAVQLPGRGPRLREASTVTEPELATWSTHTASGFRLRLLPGDHSFQAGPSGAEMLAEIGADLLQHV